MNASQTSKKSLAGRLGLALLVAIGTVALLGSTGCDEYLGGGYGYDLGWDYGYGYGPIDDDVFQSACDAWSDYIRM